LFFESVEEPLASRRDSMPIGLAARSSEVHITPDSFGGKSSGRLIFGVSRERFGERWAAQALF
jgi:hypothetical protein